MRSLLKISPIDLRFVSETLKRYKRNKASVISLCVVMALVAVAFLAPWLSPHDPWKVGVGKPFTEPCREYIMGTDNLGRDVFSGVLYGTQVSLFVGFFTALTSTIIGLAVGVPSGFYGGTVDHVLMRLTEIFQVIPRFLLALVIIAIFGSSIFNICLVLSLLTWPPTARLIRAQFLSLREKEFVEAARAVGASNLQLMLEILPNAISPVIVNTSFVVASAIITEAGLSFLGLGDPHVFSWGSMLFNAQPYFRVAWWIMLFPGIAIFLAFFNLNIVGDGLNDALNPRLRQKR